MKRQDLWDTKFHSAPLNVDPSIRIPSMFIDPVVDIFVDPCDPSFRQPREFFINYVWIKIGVKLVIV